jgi:hypothetical protein
MDWNNMQTWQYGALIGGAVLLVGLIVYFLPIRRLKVPGSITAAIGGAGLGLALGILWMSTLGYKPTGPATEGAEEPKDGGPPPGLAKGKGGGKGAPKGGFGGGAPKGGGNPPTSRVLLARLVNALDTVVDRPIALTLTPAERAALAEQLKGLESAEEIKEDDARARLDALQKILERDRKALEAVGYQWASPDAKGPPKGGFGGPKDSPNPFADGPAKERLKSLQERLDKK